MKDFENTIKEYQEGDFEKRLSLYLEHRLLREEFEQIEKHEASNGSEDLLVPEKKYNRKCKVVSNPFRRCMRWCHSIIS